MTRKSVLKHCTQTYLISKRIATLLRDITPEVSRNKALTLLIDDKYSRCHFDNAIGQLDNAIDVAYLKYKATKNGTVFLIAANNSTNF
jgi:hypothetical protein